MHSAPLRYFMVGALAAAAVVVQPGDTLSGIAAELGSTVAALVDANGIADPDHITVGQRIQAPGAGETHVVQPGESLSVIASRYGVSVAGLAATNGITDPDRLLAGTRLRIAEEPPASAATSGATASGRHVVRPGETLSHVAARTGVPVDALASANGIADPDHVTAGTTLTIPGAGAAWRCPVPGAEFINDFGIAKPDGRFHEGVDLHAPRGTPVLAPVAGTVAHAEGPRGGKQFELHGDDGAVYVGTHLDAFGASGRVAPGDPVGQVGDTGNARGGSPHLHFERLVDGRPENPFPLLQQAC